MPTTPFIPETITVHLGPPDSNAENVTLPFLDYIANVASSEIYPTWPENAIRANIYAQVSFALNREINRGGQCYYLYNRVEGIYNVANRIQKAIPDARISSFASWKTINT